jgi:putative acetyltransferase
MTGTTIRFEMPQDVPGIRAVVVAAFGQTGEANLVDGLRRSGALTLSAVAVGDNRIVGHVAFSPLTIGEKYSALALAPVAVAPDCQRQGIGTALINWSLNECRRLGHSVIIVVGGPAYYRRFGFAPASPLDLECPFPAPAEVFMLLELSAGAASGYKGTVRYHPEFEKL